MNKETKYPVINEATKIFWHNEDFEKVRRATTILELFEVAHDVISRMGDPVAQVCGPLTSGGRESVTKNLSFLNEIIDGLQKENIFVFDQMPFEEAFHRIANSTTYTENHGNILRDFYDPIFTLGKIKTLYFVEGWESSKGATWEHTRGLELGMNLMYL